MSRYDWMWLDLTEGIGDEAVFVNTIKALEDHGINSILVNSGDVDFEIHRSRRTKILSFPRSKIPFLNTLISNYRASKILAKISVDEIPNFIMVNWKLLPGFLRARRKRRADFEKCEVIIEDRSPPVGKGIKTWLQWRFYDYSWKKSLDNTDGGNVLVPSLEEFVRDRYGIKDSFEFIHTPSGVDVNRFRPTGGESSFESGVKIVYHGALDSGRGLRRIMPLLEELEKRGVPSKATIVGDGPLSGEFQKISERNPKVEFLGRVSFEELPSIVADNHYGILPLPDSLEWNVGSPLKIMEFASSGLVCLTTDVAGTEPFSDKNWITRSDKYEPIHSWIDTIIEDYESEDEFQMKRVEAREFAISKLTWDMALESLLDLIMRGKQ